jgi:hypothetical protein
VWVDGRVGPGVDYLCYCKVDDDFGEAAGRVVQVATLIRINERGLVGYLKWSFESIECVGSEEVGSVQTRYCALSCIIKCPPSATCCAIYSIIGASNGFRQ